MGHLPSRPQSVARRQTHATIIRSQATDRLHAMLGQAAPALLPRAPGVTLTRTEATPLLSAARAIVRLARLLIQYRYLATSLLNLVRLVTLHC